MKICSNGALTDKTGTLIVKSCGKHRQTAGIINGSFLGKTRIFYLKLNSNSFHFGMACATLVFQTHGIIILSLLSASKLNKFATKSVLSKTIKTSTECTQ